ncbi:hypothetical protein C8Q74DRAFT_170562 [Fomes fomentarius]|nr:hypothetical protein C8Q74DRAFT_170562 [Fomes fomentarius]
MSAAQLSTDIIHEILVNMSDLATLWATIRTCKKHHEAFQAHPKSILRTVLENAVGPALPQAARLAEYKYRSSENDPHVETLPQEDDYQTLSWIPARPIASMLEDYARRIHILRDFYSQRIKDRSSTTTKLSTEETLRFDRAVYRYWLYLEMLQNSAFWSGDDDELDNDDNDDDDDEEGREERKFREGLTAFISGLSTEELLEVLSLVTFCEETKSWAAGLPSALTGLPVNHTFVAGDPYSLARALEARQLTGDYSYGSWELVPDIIRAVLVSHKVREDELEQKQSTAIVKLVVGAEDTCSRCATIKGVQLIGQPNIYLLSGMLPVQERASLLPGLLSRNGDVTRPLLEHVYKGNNGRWITEQDLFSELIDLDPGEDEAGTEEVHSWSKDGWYCLDCLKELYKQRYMAWWKQAQAKSGAPVQDDCWYGYNCRTMTHKSYHATKLNHLCKPTRGDAPRAP